MARTRKAFTEKVKVQFSDKRKKNYENTLRRFSGENLDSEELEPFWKEEENEASGNQEDKE